MGFAGMVNGGVIFPNSVAGELVEFFEVDDQSLPVDDLFDIKIY